jgi:hypothetical protein
VILNKSKSFAAASIYGVAISSAAFAKKTGASSSKLRESARSLNNSCSARTCRSV